MPKVFVSHSAQDRAFVESEIVHLLQRNGIETWYSRDDIQTASIWEKDIRQGLDSCDWFLIVLSPRSAVSEWVKAELHWAMENRSNCIVPILMERCNPTDFHLMMGRIQHIDFQEDIEQARQGLLKVWGVDYEYERSPHELRVLVGPPSVQGTICPIKKRVIIGRKPSALSDPECAVLEIHDITLNRNHAEFVLQEDGKVLFSDLDSSNGSFVNGERVKSIILQDENKIQLGLTSFQYRRFEKNK